MTTICMRKRLSSHDAHYSGGLVNGAHNVGMLGESISRLLAKEYGNTGRCVFVEKVRLYEPCFAGDYMEYYSRILHAEGNRIKVEGRCYKIGGIPEDPPFDSTAEIYEVPKLVMAMTAVYEVPEE